MDDSQDTLLREYKQEQSQHTLQIGRMFAWIAVVSLAYLMFQDTFMAHLGPTTLFRIVGLVPAVLFLVKSRTTFRRDTTTVIRYHALTLFCALLQICALTCVLWWADPDVPGYKHGSTQGISITVLGCFVFAGGARRFLPYVVGIPVGLTVLLMVVGPGRPLVELALFSNPVIIAVVVALYSRPQERVVFSEFKMRRLAERRKAKLENSAAALARSNAELRGFARTASHDLRQPLRSISGFLEVIRKELAGQGVLKDVVAEHFDHVTRASRRMSELVSSLLVYSRATSKTPVFTAVDLNAVLADVKINLSSAIEDSGAHIESTPLPEITGDVHQLTSVLQNLVGNAIKYRRPEEEPCVSITSTDEGDAVRVAVADNGIGFAPEFAAEVFEAFRRLHGAGEYEGVGLGLAICWNFVQAHGGTMGASSAPGEGATFWFTLAKQPPEPTQMSPSRVEP